MSLLSVFKKHRLLSFVILTVVIMAAAAYIVYSREDAPKYMTQAVERGNLRSQVGATGSLTAITTTQVGTQVSGTISKWYADFNDHVKANQLIAEIEPSLFQAAYDQALANLKTSEADVANQKATLVNMQANLVKAQVGVRDAKIKLDRAQGLLKDGILAQSDFDTAQVNYDSAIASQNAAQAQIDSQVAQVNSSVARVAQAQANLKTAKVNLEHTKIYAPIDGVVVNRAIDVGQTVAASFQTPTLYTIANDLTKMQVYANIDEADVGRIQQSSGAIFTVDAYPGENFRGRISQIRLNPTTISNVVTYTAVIQVDNPDLKLMPGMTANINIQVARRDNVLKIPNAALRFIPPQAEEDKKNASSSSAQRTQQTGGQQQAARPQGGAAGGAQGATGGANGTRRTGGSRASNEQSVWVFDTKAKKLTQVPVKIGITDGIYTELVEGNLHEGDLLVVGQQIGTAARGNQVRSPMGGAPRGGGFH